MSKLFRAPIWIRALHTLFLRPFITEFRRLNANLESTMRFYGIPVPDDPPMQEVVVESMSEEDMAIEELYEDTGGDLAALVAAIRSKN